MTQPYSSKMIGISVMDVSLDVTNVAKTDAYRIMKAKMYAVGYVPQLNKIVAPDGSVA